MRLPAQQTAETKNKRKPVAEATGVTPRPSPRNPEGLEWHDRYMFGSSDGSAEKKVLPSNVTFICINEELNVYDFEISKALREQKENEIDGAALVMNRVT